MSKKVAYLYNQNLTKFQFSKDHFMKPRRIKMAHSLVQTFRLDEHLTIINSKEATLEELCAFHHEHYVKYLQTWVNPQPQKIVQSLGPLPEGSDAKYREHFVKDSALGSIFKVNQIIDCPGFQGLFHFCKLAAGGSIDAADSIIAEMGDIVINWGGGYHHAKKSQASGFCYVNDIVLCILQLLKVYPRVLYLDIDVHHGDGVEEAFYKTNRVMTVSFHQYEEGFFPQTGALENIGAQQGKFYSVNVPLKPGIDDATYYQLFKCIMQRVMESFRPDAVVVQCGADSLAKDKLGSLNLSIRGHGRCLNFIKSFNTPMILLGGGGYTIENVARCWAYQTGQMLGIDIGNEVPVSDPYHYYYMKDDYRIHFDVNSDQENLNSKGYLNDIVQTITENLRSANSRPSVGFHRTEKPVNNNRRPIFEQYEEEQQRWEEGPKSRMIRKY